MEPGSISRRHFLARSLQLGAGLGAAGLFLGPASLHRLFPGTECGAALAAPDELAELIRLAPVARYWTSAGSKPSDCRGCHLDPQFDPSVSHEHADPKMVQCLLCAQRCLIPAGSRGRCRVRYNDDGVLRSLNYGHPAAMHVDPIEKKPFFHFLPGSQAFSLATVGCPLHCRFCQNWEISQGRPEDAPGEFIAPVRLAEAAATRKVPVVAFTYNEPTVFLEYLVDIARRARKHERRTVLVSCGFMNEAPLDELCGCLDAIKIDLKGFSPDFYRKVCSAELDPVLRSIKQVARRGVHLELVNLVVPTLNDSSVMLHDLCHWVMDELGPDVPVHFTRFHPDYQLQHLPPTPVATLEKAREMALTAGLHYPYVGNVPGNPGNHTYCPACGAIVIERHGFLLKALRMRDGSCSACGRTIAGVWS
jgi:pyruvate formate lyase activating enzyme